MENNKTAVCGRRHRVEMRKENFDRNIDCYKTIDETINAILDNTNRGRFLDIDEISNIDPFEAVHVKMLIWGIVEEALNSGIINYSDGTTCVTRRIKSIKDIITFIHIICGGNIMFGKYAFFDDTVENKKGQLKYTLTQFCDGDIFVNIWAYPSLDY